MEKKNSEVKFKEIKKAAKDSRNILGGCSIAILSSGLTIIGLVVGLILLIGWALNSSEVTDYKTLKNGDDDKKIVVLNIDGVITESNEDSAFSSDCNAKKVIENLEKIKKDKTVKAIILNINSPGGEIVASDDIYNEILKVKKVKPVYAYISSMGASGAYYVAAGADSITAHRSAIVGSIGVIMNTVDMTGLYDKLGVKVYTFKSGDFKDNSALRDPEKAGELKKIYQGLIDTNLETFIKVVAAGRHMSEDDVRKLADGRVYTAQQSVENGLIDKIGYLDDVIAEASQKSKLKNPKVVELETKGGLLSSLEGLSGFKSISSLVKNKQHGIYMYYLLKL